MKDVPIAGKFLILLAIFGLLNVSAVMWSSAQMRGIDAGYASAVHIQGQAAIFASRANRALAIVKSAIGDLEIGTTEADNQAGYAEFMAAKARFLDALDTAIEADPLQAVAFKGLRSMALKLIDETCASAITLGRDSTISPTIGQAEYFKTCGPAFKPVVDAVTNQATQSIVSQNKLVTRLAQRTASVVMLNYVLLIGATLFVAGLGFLGIRFWVSKPIVTMVTTMRALAAGDLDVTIVGGNRHDELGPMARALQVFKDKSARLRASEAESVELRHQHEAMVHAIAIGLDAFARGDLTSRLDEAFAADYEKLRSDFNKTAESLRAAMETIVVATLGINNGSEQIAAASDDLSRRTEQQAANLEETSAALQVITESMMRMARNARDAAEVAASTRGAVETSSIVVQDAVDAMAHIKHSSSQIGRIIGVIDDIAFQTTLLALNASIEAAGAGDVGRGFAVVALEVRSLAQRTVEAARQIKALVETSTRQVENGVVLVDQTGAALKTIVSKVAEMDTLVGEISASSQVQAAGLAEINGVINQIDHVVQQNAAMVEESAAAAHALKRETQDLNGLVGRFRLNTTRSAEHAAPAPLDKGLGTKPWRSLAHRFTSQVAMSKPAEVETVMADF